ncbi:unnamed protein product [Ceratitis capitata]|uniref:(Mediterranean fruit fly) hypothetical protein n=1 Tax=Ceratitis capitata TaxID=7213 RepID=A0A811VDU2_CERCA|nr:unnamed protein product [Ceratitis capitata]
MRDYRYSHQLESQRIAAQSVGGSNSNQRCAAGKPRLHGDNQHNQQPTTTFEVKNLSTFFGNFWNEHFHGEAMTGC